MLSCWACAAAGDSAMHHGFHAFNTHEPGMGVDREGSASHNFKNMDSDNAEARCRRLAAAMLSSPQHTHARTHICA